MDELPAKALASVTPPALTLAIAGNAMTDAIDPAELLDVDVDQITRMLTLIAAHRLGRFER